MAVAPLVAGGLRAARVGLGVELPGRLAQFADEVPVGPRLPTTPEAMLTARVSRSVPGAPWWSYERPPRHDEGAEPAAEPAAEPVAAVAAAPAAPLVPAAGDGARRSRSASAGLDVHGDRPAASASPWPPCSSSPSSPWTGGAGPATTGAVLVPVAGLLFAASAAKRFTRIHPDEPYLPRWIVYGVVAKIGATYFRYTTLVNSYGGQGDRPTTTPGVGGSWTAGSTTPAPEPAQPHETNFVRWFTGVVYWCFGANMLAGFFVFGLLALVGSYLWYRATADSVSFIDKRLYLALVLFAPSVAFWPTGIGKEALMQLGIGVVAFGTGYLLRARLFQGLLLCGAGGWLLWVVRPHLLALVTLAGAAAYIVGRVRGEGTTSSFLSRPVGMVAVVLLCALTVTQGAKYLGMEDLSLGSVQAELDQQTERSAQGGSSYDNGGNSLSPLSLPKGAVTVLLRPFPWETDSALQLLASLESATLALLDPGPDRLRAHRGAAGPPATVPPLRPRARGPLLRGVLVVRQLRAPRAAALARAAGPLRDPRRRPEGGAPGAHASRSRGATPRWSACTAPRDPSVARDG